MRRYEPGSGALLGQWLYQYDLDGHLLFQIRHNADGINQAAQYWVWLDDQSLAQVDLAFASSGAITASRLVYLHPDHLQTPRLATDGNGEVVWRWNSDAYGMGAVEEDVDQDANLVSIPLRLPGQLFDSASQLNYNYFRDYDPETGRYVESDPIGLEGQPFQGL